MDRKETGVENSGGKTRTQEIKELAMALLTCHWPASRGGEKWLREKQAQRNGKNKGERRKKQQRKSFSLRGPNLNVRKEKKEVKLGGKDEIEKTRK